MKLRILLFFTFLSFGLNAQTVVAPSGSTNGYYTYRGAYHFTVGMRLPNDNSTGVPFPNVSDKTGLFRYNPTLQVPQYYDGLNWISIGGQMAIPTLQQVLTAGSTANITSPFIVNYKSGTPQAVELSINDANFSVGLPGSNNTLTFDDAQLISTRSITVPDGTLDQHTVNVRQLNQAIGNISNPTLDQVTTNGNTTNNPITTGGYYATDGSTTALIADETGGLRTTGVLQFQYPGQTAHSLAAPGSGNYTWGLPHSDGTLVDGIIMNGTTYTPDISGKVTLPNTTTTPSNLSYTASGTNGVVNNSNGTGFTIPAVTGTNAGFQLPGDYTRLLNTSGTNTGDNATNTTSNTYADGKVQNSLTPASTTKAPSVDVVNTALNGKQALINGTGIPVFNGTTVTWVPIIAGHYVRPDGTTANLISAIDNRIAVAKYTSNFTSITANYTVTLAAFGQNGQLDIFANATSGNITITLPGATTMAGYQINIIKTDNTANTVIINGAGTNINQQGTYSLTTQNQNGTIKSDNTQYRLFN